MEKRTVSLPDEHAAFVDAKVADGSFASVSEVIRAGLRALKERDQAVEKWLETEVAPIFDKMEQSPEKAIKAESVFERIKAHHADRLKEGL